MRRPTPKLMRAEVVGERRSSRLFSMTKARWLVTIRARSGVSLHKQVIKVELPKKTKLESCMKLLMIRCEIKACRKLSKAALRLKCLASFVRTIGCGSKRVCKRLSFLEFLQTVT